MQILCADFDTFIAHMKQNVVSYIYVINLNTRNCLISDYSNFYY